MKICVIGCSHGELDQIYEDVQQIEAKDDVHIDLVIICGDFQSVRNENDLTCMSVPHKFRELRTFHKYYSGESVAPKLTIFIGGNHEASNYLQSLAFGGWVANNIYFMGYGSVVNFKGVRIGGISGIHNNRNSDLGHFERLPYDENSKRSAYHMRHSDVYKLMQLNNQNETNTEEVHQPIDIFISHDWPLNIHSCGDVKGLLRRKKHFLNDIRNNALGNPLLEPLVRHLKPKHWFSAHLHVRFEAVINHTEDCKIQTKFLALDKVLPNRSYLEIIDIEPSVATDDNDLHYDPEWLAVLKATDKLLSIEKRCATPSLWSRLDAVEQEDIDAVKQLFNNDLKVANNFVMSEPALNGRLNDSDPDRVRNYTNPQTTEFCRKLGIRDPIQVIIDSMKPIPNPDQISISDDEEEEESEQKRQKTEDIDGGEIFFIDRKGGDVAKGDKFSDSLNSNQIEKNINCNRKQETDQPIDVIDLTEDKQSNNVQTNVGNTKPNEQLLTKRQLKRRAEKVKRRTELKQLEKFDVKTDKSNKQMRKFENKKSAELRRKIILERLEWVKANLVMKDSDSEILVLDINGLTLSQSNIQCESEPKPTVSFERRTDSPIVLSD